MSDFTPPSEPMSPLPSPRAGNGRMMMVVAGLILVLAVLIVVGLLATGGGKDEDEVQVTPIQPVPAIALTPLWDTIATLEANEAVDPAEVAELRRQMEELDEENVKADDLNAIIDGLDTTYVDSAELRGELNTFLESEGFESSVLDIVSEANQQATQTQQAIECLVETLPEYPSVTAHEQPSDAEPRADFIYKDRKYRVIGRTDGAINTENLWWQIEIDPLNNLRGWVRSDFVAESDDTKCMAIAIR